MTEKWFLGYGDQRIVIGRLRKQKGDLGEF